MRLNLRGGTGAYLLQSLLGLLLAPVCNATGPQGVIIEAIAPASAAERAGLQPGDELAAWSAESGGSGVLRTPFDLAYVGIEHAPRGIVTLRGFRKGEEKSWRVRPGDWGIKARPALEPDLLALYEQGRQQIASGNLDAGMTLWRSVLESLERRAVPEHTSWLESQLANALAAAGRWPEADAAWTRAVHRLEPQRASGAAHILYAWGRSLYQRNAYGHAEACHLRALHLKTKKSLAAAWEFQALGIIARNRDDLTTAEHFLHQAYSLRENLAPGSLELASSLTDLGILAGLRGDMAAAEERFSKALELQQWLAPESMPVAGILLNLVTIAQKDDFDFENFQSAINLIEPLSPNDPNLAFALSNFAFLSSHTGVYLMNRGELASAERSFWSALAIRQKLAPESLEVASILQDLGFVAEERGDFAAAEEHYRRALEIREKLAPDSGGVAEILTDLGTAVGLRGELAQADEYYRQILAIRDGISRKSAAMIQLKQARLAVARGDLALAEELYGRALSFLEKSAAFQVSDCLRGLGVIAFKQGDLTKAEELFRRALARGENMEPGSTEIGLSLNALGQVYRRERRHEMAAEYLCRATKAFDQQRKKVGGPPEGRSAFGGKTAEYYRDCLGAQIDIDRPAEAFRVLERGRARSFLDLLVERDLRWTADLPPELARDQKQMNTEYDRTQAALARLSPGRDQVEMDRLLVRLRELRARQEDLAAEIRQSSPRAAAVQDPQPLDLAGARAALDPGTLLLAWSIGRERSFLFVVQPAGTDPGLEVFPLAIDDQALRERVGSFLNLLQRANSDRTALSRQARELYDVLLRPAEARIIAAKRLLISPDGPLHILPFAALVHDGHYLAEKKPIHTVISATVYAELKRSRRERSSTPQQVELAAFGDPSYPALAPRQPAAVHPEVRAAAGRGLALTPLPSSREEVRSIAAFYSEARTYLGSEATEERAKAIGKDTRYLHFACHGLLDERFPLNSGLALTIPKDADEGQENGLLQAWEIFESVRLDADLVTLSACDTALGQEMGGEGLLGLTRAFQYAGARSVLASLWSVSDVSTAELMKRFYGYLSEGRSKDEALRAAQADLIRSQDFPHPYYWAAFQLTGDWR
jgi:CHAT domain-containing protein/Tfp pilus assembly protein PilF